MKITPLIVTATLISSLVACSDDPITVSAITLFRTWCGKADDGNSQCIDIRDDHTYTLTETEATGPRTADVSQETGNFDLTSGGNATLTPEKSACVGPHPRFNITFLLANNNDLVVVYPGTVITYMPTALQRATAQDTIGCFDIDGNFTPGPVVTIKN